MRHHLPFFLTTHPIRPFDEKVLALPIPIGIRNVGYQLQLILPYSKVVYPFRRDDMFGSVAPKELVKG